MKHYEDLLAKGCLKVLECLARNKNGFLYQKCGYLFKELEGVQYFQRAFEKM